MDRAPLTHRPLIHPYYQDSMSTIYFGDCRDILPSIDNKGSQILICTDPPYGTQGLGGGYGRRQVHDPSGRNSRQIEGDCDLSVLADVVPQFTRLLSNGGWLFSFCAARRMPEVIALLSLPPLTYQGEIIWDKGSPGLGFTIRYAHESCLVYSSGEIGAPTNALMSVVHFPISHINTEQRHPHEKPVNFWINAIQISDGIVLDPFMGSGTTLIAAKRLGRRSVGIEIEERYCEMAANRVKKDSSFFNYERLIERKRLVGFFRNV